MSSEAASLANRHPVRELLTYQQAKAYAKKLGLFMAPCNSNLLTPTINAGIQSEVRHFFNVENSMADKIVITRRKLFSQSGFPYKPARLVPPDGDVTKPWYIIFYLWDIGKQKIVRKRVFHDKLNRIPDRVQRLEFAEYKIDEINQCLYLGMHAEGSPEKKLPGFDFRGYSIVDGINYAMNYKLQIEQVKKGTISEYKKLKSVMVQFLRSMVLPADYKLRMVNQTFVDNFFPYLKETRQVSNKTYNHYRMIFHAVIQVLMKKDPKVFPNGNPIAAIKFLKTESRKHAAYNEQQLHDIQEDLKKNNDVDGLLFIQFMFYTLGRPKEIESLKVGHIFLKERRIRFESESAKTSIEGYVGISDRFAEIIVASGILNYPSDYYIFSRSKTPGTKKVGKNYFYKKIRRYIYFVGIVSRE